MHVMSAKKAVGRQARRKDCPGIQYTITHIDRKGDVYWPGFEGNPVMLSENKGHILGNGPHWHCRWRDIELVETDE